MSSNQSLYKAGVRLLMIFSSSSPSLGGTRNWLTHFINYTYHIRPTFLMGLFPSWTIELLDFFFWLKALPKFTLYTRFLKFQLLICLVSFFTRNFVEIQFILTIGIWMWNEHNIHESWGRDIDEHWIQLHNLCLL